MKLVIKAAWAPTPSPAVQKVVVQLPDGFSVVKAPSHRRASDTAYFLMHHGTQAGSAFLVKIEGKPDTYWLDVVFLEKQYRGKNYMRSLLWFVVRDWKDRPVLLDARNENLSTYKAVGFVPMTAAQKHLYANAIRQHRRAMHYPDPFSHYTTMILTENFK